MGVIAAARRRHAASGRAWTTTVAGWTLLALTAAYALLMSAATVLAVAGSSDGETTTSLGGVVVTALFFVVPVHVWAFLVARGLLRRRSWARWAAVATSTVFALSVILPVSAGDHVPRLLWGALAANVLVVVLAAHPATGRDLRWAEKERTRPDYVADRARRSS